MLGLIIPLGIAYLVWRSSHKKEMTASQRATLDKALASTNPGAIAKVAVAFGREGHSEAMRRLKIRAGLRLRDPAEVLLHCEAFRNALTEPSGRGTSERTREVALKLKGKEMTESAKFLEDFARGFERSRNITPVYVPTLGPSGAETEGLNPSVVPNMFESESAAKEPRDPDLPEGMNPGDPPIDYMIEDDDLPPPADDAGGMQ